MDKKFSKDKRFKKNPAVKEFTKKVYKTFTGIKKHNNLPKDTLSCFSKSHRLPTQVILLFGGWNGAQTLNKTECYNLKSNDWYINNKLSDPAGGRCYFSLECIKNVIYIIGTHILLIYWCLVYNAFLFWFSFDICWPLRSKKQFFITQEPKVLFEILMKYF